MQNVTVKIVDPVPCIFIVTWLAGDINEPTHLSKRVGHGVSRFCCLALSHGLLGTIGLTSLHLSLLFRIVQEIAMIMTVAGETKCSCQLKNFRLAKSSEAFKF